MKPLFRYFILPLVAFLLLGSCQKSITAKTGIVKFTFRNMVSTSPMALVLGVYTNPFGEVYSITRFKYYVSNIHLTGTAGSASEANSYHLVDESIPGSLTFSFETDLNTFSGISFLIGVDSTRNVSGAQTGALDPLNDMFWTWNSGYIMAKMEGTSPQSNQVGNKIEYHIGGFSGVNSALKTVNLPFPAGKSLIINEGKISEISLEADFDKWWQTPNDLMIVNTPVCTTPGSLAKQVADNYSKMFTVTNVVNN
jgi:hypothetical protein